MKKVEGEVEKEIENCVLTVEEHAYSLLTSVKQLQQLFLAYKEGKGATIQDMRTIVKNMRQNTESLCGYLERWVLSEVLRGE